MNHHHQRSRAETRVVNLHPIAISVAVVNAGFEVSRTSLDITCSRRARNQANPQGDKRQNLSEFHDVFSGHIGTAAALGSLGLNSFLGVFRLDFFFLVLQLIELVVDTPQS